MDDNKKAAKSTKTQKIYTANDICNIIKTCSKHGVTNIKISGIEVNFMNQGTDSPQSGMNWTPPKVKPLKKGDTTPLKALELTEKDLEEIEELERAQQAIDDPVGYEARIIDEYISGELNEANGYS